MDNSNLNKAELENVANTRMIFGEGVKGLKTVLGNENKNLTSLNADLRKLRAKLKLETDPNKKKAINTEITNKESEVSECKGKIEFIKSQLQAALEGVKKQEEKITKDNPEVAKYIRYAKATTYNQQAESCKNQISVNKRINDFLNSNPRFKKMAEEYVSKIEEISRINSALKKARGENNTAKINAQQTLLTEAKKDETNIKNRMNDWATNYNKTSMKSLKMDEVFSVLKSIPIEKRADGKVDIEASINKGNEQLEKDCKRNENLRNYTIEKSYQDGILLNGMPGYNYDNLKKYGETEEQFRNRRVQELKDSLESAYGLNTPIVYKGFFQKLRHPFKAFKEHKQRKESTANYERAFNDALTNIPNEYIQYCSNNLNSKQPISKDEFERYSFGKETSKIIDSAIRNEMKADKNLGR